MGSETFQITPVVLSGGAGTRLWPLSRELYPKQLLPLVGDQTLLQQTLMRLDGLEGITEPIVVCNDAHRFMVAEQLRQIASGRATILLEPIGRNTAPAVVLAALQAQQGGNDPILLVLPADHVIRENQSLCDAIRAGAVAAAQGNLVTFGIVPSAPETGYGYLLKGAPATENPGLFAVERFVEKPDQTTAEEYLAAGCYLWNSGMFLFRASTYLAELEKFAPAILTACQQSWDNRQQDLDFVRIDAQAFAASPSDSIDYAVMEKTGRAMVVPLDAGWSDIGSWAALWEVGNRDGHGNLTHGDVIAVDCVNSFLHGGARLVAGVGLNNLVVVETSDAVLVAAKDRVQDVKQVVEELKRTGRQERLLHRRVNRPWGAYEELDGGDGFLVKRITVNPDASLSLQRHRHRAEHWVVVRGTARVTCGDQVLTREANQSVYIPIGDLHRLENPGSELLEIIEVQTGELLSEDDIERFEDHYGRT